MKAYLSIKNSGSYMINIDEEGFEKRVRSLHHGDLILFTCGPEVKARYIGMMYGIPRFNLEEVLDTSTLVGVDQKTKQTIGLTWD